MRFIDKRHSSFGEAFDRFIAQGELRYARCPECARALSFAERLCVRHPHKVPEWLPASGRAMLHTFAVYRIGYAPEFPPPYCVGMVELEEGPRLLCAISGPEGWKPAIGVSLEARFEPSGRLVFDTAE